MARPLAEHLQEFINLRRNHAVGTLNSKPDFGRPQSKISPQQRSGCSQDNAPKKRMSGLAEGSGMLSVLKCQQRTTKSLFGSAPVSDHP